MKSRDIVSKPWTESEMQAFRGIAARQASGKVPASRSGDIPPLSRAQLSAMVRLREPKPARVPVSLRLDPRVLAWLKSKGTGHLTRINDILANLMEAEQFTASRRRG